MAIDQQVPIVPVTLPFNWKLLPDDGKMLLRGRHIDVIIHPAIDTKGLNEGDIQDLREKVHKIIQAELDQRSGIDSIDENR